MNLETARILTFDLDGTLWDYQRAARAATQTVYNLVQDEFGIEPARLAAVYAHLVKADQERGFVANQQSRDYRAARFKRLLNSFSIIPTPWFMESLLEIYEQTLLQHTVPYPGVVQLLRERHARQLKTVIITEGPADAQMRTIDALGIRDLVDAVFTSAELGRSKTGGLFQAVLDRLGLHPGELFYVGDSQTRDIEPARAAGISAELHDQGLKL